MARQTGRRKILLAVAIAFALLSPRAWAASTTTHPPVWHLFVTATGQQHGTLTIKQAVTIVPPRPTQPMPPYDFSTRSPYFGLIISQRDRIVFGLYVDRALPIPVVFGDATPRLAPGQYDVTVLSPQRLVVQLQLTGARHDYRIRLDKPTVTSRTTTSANLAPDAPVIYASEPAAIHATTVTVIVLDVSMAFANAIKASECLVAQPVPCAPGSIGSGSDYSWGNTGTGRAINALIIGLHNVVPGNYYATADAAMIAIPQRAQLTVFTADIPAGS